MNRGLSTQLAATIFDPDLAALCKNEWRTMHVPLAIKRFVEEYGADRPSLAMKMATDSLMFKYSDGRHLLTEPVSLKRLCEISDVELIKNPFQVRSFSGNGFDGFQRRTGHTGRVFFKGSKATIKIPKQVDSRTERISIAHELGHLLIHSRTYGYDKATLRLPSSAAEESLAEYCARLLLIPGSLFSSPPMASNIAQYAYNQKCVMNVTLHSAVMRLGDPDLTSCGVRGAILWQLNSTVSKTEPMSARLTPRWHVCPRAFVPIGKCKARTGSVVAEVAGLDFEAGKSKIEEVRIGTFVGTFQIDAYAWNFVKDGTRLVLSIFRDLNPGLSVHDR